MRSEVYLTGSHSLAAKILIIVLLVLMVASLGAAMWSLLKDRGRGTRTVKALTIRISLWVVLLIVLLAGIHMGWLEPSQSIRMP